MRFARLAQASLFAAVLVARPVAAAAEQAHPDLNGVWTNASVTKLTRPRGEPRLVLTPAEAKAKAASDGLVRFIAGDNAPIDPKAGAPKPSDFGPVNGFWADPGTTYAQVKGQFRTSWIIDPADGQLPFSAEGRRRVAIAQAFAARADTPADPEQLEPWDRCLIGSRGSGGPGMLNNIYNSNYQIVQTRDAVAIVVEMIHEVRTIPIFRGKAAAQAGHGPTVQQNWLGDSVGWWEGGDLVVETLNVNPEQGRAGPIFLTPQGRVTERFSRPGGGPILYEFQVEDPTYYSRPWRAEMTLAPNRNRLFEYACHEGNYAMANILRGVRLGESKLAARQGGAP